MADFYEDDEAASKNDKCLDNACKDVFTDLLSPINSIKKEIEDLHKELSIFIFGFPSPKRRPLNSEPPSRRNLSGVYDGYYMQLGREYPFTLTVENESANIFKGYISEPLPLWAGGTWERLAATVEGCIDYRIGELVFTKTYISESVTWKVLYRGMMQGKDIISGRWVLSGTSDIFSITRRHSY